MKDTLLLLAFSAFIFSGCKDQGTKPAEEHGIIVHKYRPPHHGAGQDSSQCDYIPVDSANRMINSYLASISGDSVMDLHSLDYDVDSLISYLQTAGIKHVKFMFAHTLDYINAGGYGQYAGYQSGALTLVIAGYDAQGNYVYYQYPKTQNCPLVEDHFTPCPNDCPTQGTASSDTLPVQPTTHGR